MDCSGCGDETVVVYWGGEAKPDFCLCAGCLANAVQVAATEAPAGVEATD